MKPKFVIVDDAAFLREVLKNIISSENVQIVGEAENGSEAIVVVDQTRPDAVFLDLVMPIKNGIEAALAIKNKHPNIKIIGCSTVDQINIINQAKAVGFDEYITKPFSKDQINKIISKLFNQGGETHGSI
jgi:two-component system chemotaxis response regulator CheY